MKPRWTHRLRTAALYFVLILGCIPILGPLVWMISTSLKTQEDAAAYPPRVIPVRVTATLNVGEVTMPVELIRKIETGAVVRKADGTVVEARTADLHVTEQPYLDWSNYRKVLLGTGGRDGDDFPRYLLNTLVIAGLSIVGTILSSSLVAWGFARRRFAGRGLLFGVMLATMMIPAQVTMVPSFILYRNLGWIDSFLPLIVPAWLASPFFVFLYRQFFMGIPTEMDEAAEVDGCSPIATYWSILLPLARPVSITVGVYSFFGAWNDLLGPLIYINSDQKRTLSLALAKFQGAYSTDVPAVMAAATLMLIPVLVVFFVSQRSLIQGMTVSGVKG